MKRERNSGIEVLRIISMLLIIAYHFAVHGLVNTGFFDNNNNYVINAFAIGGKLGVSVFVLISGYFSTGHKLNYRRLATLEFEVLFYSIGLYLVSLLTDLEISRSDLKVLFPVIFSEYWFITDYLILMLLSPFLNAAICNTEKKSLKNIILLSICIWSLLPCLLRENTTYSDLIWFIVLYILAAYLKKYGGRISPRMLLLCSIGTFFLILCFSEITLWYGMRIDSQKLRAISGYYGNLNSPLVLLCSVTTLLYVLSRKEFSCTIINKVSEACFGVYLIHDNPHLRTWLWGFFLQEKEHLTPIGLAKYGACVVLLIFCVCCVIDWTRSFLFANVMKCLVHRTSFEKVKNVEEGGTIEK